jgi:hypothetical protein
VNIGDDPASSPDRRRRSESRKPNKTGISYRLLLRALN